MRKFTKVITLLMIMLLSSSLTFAQYARITDTGPAGNTIKATSNSRALLYEQIDFDANGRPSQDFEVAYDAYDSWGADDFVVPSGESWFIQSVIAYGSGSGPFDLVNVEFYNDVAGMPEATPFATFPGIASVDNSGELTADLGTGITLPSGHYWVVMQDASPFASSGQWFWTMNTNVYNSNAVWKNPNGGFGTGATTWTTLNAIWGDNKDFAFALDGDVLVPCDYQVELTDPGYGDGWNGGTLTVFVDGSTVLNNVTLSSGSGPVYYTFGVSTGQEITTDYTPGGWPYENHYKILDADGNVVFQTGYPNGQPNDLGPGVLFGSCAVLGDVDGYVFNGAGLTIAGALVGMEGYPTTTTDPTGYYYLSQVAGDMQDVTVYKEGYNIATDNFYITPGGVTTHDFTLTAPSLTINPLFFDEVLNPNEYLTTYLGILNTGDGDGGWTAVINYPPSASAGSQDITNIEVRDFSNIDYSGANVSTIPGGNGEPMSARAGLDCPDGSVFAYPAVGADNGYTSDASSGYQCYQSFSGATGSFTTVTVWAIHTSAPAGPRELLVEVYEAGSTPGALVSSDIVMVDPVNTGVPVIGYDTYSYTISIPSSDLVSGWVSVSATAGGTPTFYWLNTYGTPSYPALQNSTVLAQGLAMCLSSSGVSGWLSLSAYDGIVPGNGGSQNVGVNFDATGTAVGDVYTAEIVISTDPAVGEFTIPVTMTIFGDPLAPVTDLVVNLTDEVTGQVDLSWAFTGDVTFQYFMVKRDGLPVGTTTDLFFTDMLPDFGTYCYTVTPVFDEGNGVPAGPECTEWYIPALCWSPATLYNEQWPDSQEEVIVTLENCGEGTLDFVFPDYVSGSRFSCDYQMELTDDFGDGWNGGTLDVFVNGNLVLDNITVASGTGPVYYSFTVEGGDEITTTYVAGGWSYENEYNVLDCNGSVVYTDGAGGSTPTGIPAGALFAVVPAPSYIVTVEPAMGQIPQGLTMDIVLTYDATGFPAGLYPEWLNIETNDPLRQSDSIFNEMLVYIPGQLFGTVTDCNSGAAMSGVTVTAFGDLGEIYMTETDGSGYYEMFVDEDTYDVNFALLGFESSLVIDVFAPTGVMTEVSTTMCETPYPVNWVYADPNEADTECEVTWTLPMGPYEIIYDDGEANDYVVWTTPGGAVGVHFTPAGYPATVIGGRLNVGDGSFPAGANFIGTEMAVGVMDDDGTDGLPGTLLDSVVVDVANFGWVDFYGVFNTTIMDGDFYIVMWQLGFATNSAPVGVDTDLPTVYRSVAKMPGMGWSMSPYQDFMIRSYVSGPNAGVVSNAASSGAMVRLPKVTQGPFLATSLPKGVSGTVKDGDFKPVEVTNATRDMTNYTIARVSDFDPDLGPETGTLTPLANPTTEIYNDVAFGGLTPGFYAYAVKAVYETGESIWVYSNVVAHGLDNEFTVNVSLCDGNDPDNAEVTLVGLDYPYDIHFGVTDIDGVVVFDSVIDGQYDLFVFKVGYTQYEHLDLAIYDDMTYSLVLTEIAYAPRNLFVEPLTSVATWDEPLITAMYTQDFEGVLFPPEGWQATSNEVGWFRADDNSPVENWIVPPGDGFYALDNDDLAGSTNDGSADYLITPELDLRESPTFNLSFSSFYDAAFGESAYVEYSFDGGITWEVLQTMSPASDWTDVVVDLSAFSGLDSSPIWIAFHADDNGEWASGWGVDNVLVNNGPSPILGYYVYLNDAFVTQTAVDERTWTYYDLAYGETYTAAVRALYACGLSDPIEYRWTSSYLHPPRNLGDEYIYGTNEVPLMWNPPMTGVVPMAAAFNIVYVGPQLKAIPATADAANTVTVIEFENTDNSRDFGDFEFSFPNQGVSEAGCESDGEFIYTAVWNSSDFLKYDLAGNLLETFQIAGVSGCRDMAYDGEFMYGGAASTTVFVMDFTTQTLVTTFTAPAAVRAIAYNDDDQVFYANNWGTDIVTFDATGANLGSFTPSVTGIYGLAFDKWSEPGVPYLWAYDQGADNLVQFALPGGAPTGLTIDVGAITGATAIAGGAFTQPGLFAADKVTIGGNAQGDIVWGIELADYSVGPTPGQVPDGLVSFNLYRDGVNIANIPYEGQGVDEFVNYVDNNLDPATYLYDVSAVYDLTIFGFPGEEGESAWHGTDTVEVIWGFALPFFEGWDNGSFDFQGWSFNDNSANWVINSQEGAPAPSAEFTWDPLLENDYSSTLTSNPLLGDMLTEGDIFFDFDIALDDRNSTGEEKMIVEVYNGMSWNVVAEFVNDGSYDFTSQHIEITNYAMGKVFKVRFNAIGQNSFDIVSWFVDNISIYRECMAPTDLSGEYLWNDVEDFGANVCWEAPFIPGPISEWIHWDSGENFSGIGLTDGGVFSVAARWDAGQLSDYDGTSITKMQYLLQDDGYTNVVVKIWSGANASTLLWEEDVTSTSVVGAWNEVTLTTPLTLDVNEELWVGYTITQTAGMFPAGTDAGPAVAGYGDMITTDGVVWDPLSGFGLDYNWNVQFYVTEASSSSPSPTLIDDVVYTATTGIFERGLMKEDPIVVTNNTSRDIIGFYLYRMEDGATDYELYDYVDYVDGQTSYCYFDAYPNVSIGQTYNYKVTAHYSSDTDECESAPAMDVPLDFDYVTVLITGIDDLNASSLTNVFPNPAQDIVNVTSTLPMTQITVTNYVGQVVYTNEMNGSTSIQLNTSSYQSGVYLVKIDTENGVVTKRVVITK